MLRYTKILLSEINVHNDNETPALGQWHLSYYKNITNQNIFVYFKDTCCTVLT